VLARRIASGANVDVPKLAWKASIRLQEGPDSARRLEKLGYEDAAVGRIHDLPGTGPKVADDRVFPSGETDGHLRAVAVAGDEGRRKSRKESRASQDAVCGKGATEVVALSREL
jgi:hypothetical protein